MIYVAQPYSGSTEIREIRYQIGMAYSAHLIKTGIVGVYSPIVHCHVMTKLYDMPTDHEFWRNENFHMLSLSTEMHVLELDGYMESRGLNAELNYIHTKDIMCWRITKYYIKLNIPGADKWLQKHKELVTD